ncbi:hypothetical protein CC85DRAFT_292798 [Cutaneotrichosporon oleaginosum]|uniref:CBM21 domain-containing protein n=1 Tax=Cutaneotrichosporon oleaginosum TaxID=879819 RepID=A0A0J1B0L6_9TREE|nr:uncharacterized protein CC85DRAFT_292798 [Cutaneotrichosporon oleaginosum]KLT41154.1 hypothetical protein CC85DRAFT_292798 [Cutaneotrichosporon oleaginosum]TXT14128.1 hypothetical protein COLE_00321 [Cutaneotrichosporon oleaginosum]
MPYAEPTSPTSPLSPLGDARPRYARRHSHNTSLEVRPTTSPMPGLPRRATSSALTTTTNTHSHRKGTLSNSPRTAANSAAHREALDAMRTVEPLQSPPAKGSDYSILGLRIDKATPSSTSRAAKPPALAPSTPPVSHSTSHLLQRQKRVSSSSSSSSLPSPTEPPEPHSPVNSTRPSDRMVRKKSGEMVKPALKNRSLSTPDLGRGGKEDLWAKSKSSHNLRERTKSVRFDECGLESVVHFARGQRPDALIKGPDGEDDQEHDLSDSVHFRTRRSGVPRGAGVAQTEIQIDTCSAVPRVRLDFGPGTYGLLNNEYVVLERIEMSQPLGLRGSVLVRNIAFEKWVAVRFTLDDWQTVSEVSASHVSHIPAGTTGDEGWDRFTFNIKLEDYRRKIENRSFMFCVRYNANGGEWWDSNGGQNYHISFKQQAKSRQRPTSQYWSGSLTHGTASAETTTLPRRNGPRNWSFPKSTVQAIVAPPERPDSPALSPPPQGAFRAPSAPDVHSHLRLQKYCAPSPPQSPPKTLPSAVGGGLVPIVLPLAPERARAVPPSPMTLVHGRPATTWVPTEFTVNAEDEVFTTTSEESSEVDSVGESTPTAAGARSPEMQPIIDGATFVTSPVTSPVTARAEDKGRSNIQRNTSVSGDLHSLASVDSSVGLMTPPSSNLSSPPTPTTLLPPESPTTSMSTGDSSPVNTCSSVTPDDNVDGGRLGGTLNAATYQEFLERFCFFKSPPTTAMALEEQYTGSYFPPVTGSSYYSGFGLGSTTPPGAITPTFDRFNMARATTPTNASATSGSSSTPRASPTRSPAPNTFPLPWTPEDPALKMTAA